MPAFAKKGKASTGQVIHGTKGKRTNQKDLKKQMKKNVINSSELVTDNCDGSDAKMKMDPMKNTSGSPKHIRSDPRDKKSLFISLPNVLDITNGKKLLTAIEDGITPYCRYVTLYMKKEDDAIAAQEQYRKVKIDGEALYACVNNSEKDKKSLFVKMPDTMEIESYRQFLTALETTSYACFQYDTIVHKQQDEALATQKRLMKVELDGEATQCYFDFRTPLRDRKSLFIEMPDITEIENHRQFLTALETASHPLFQYVSIFLKEEEEAKSAYSRLSKVKIDGRPLVLDM